MLELILLNIQLNSHLTERAWHDPQFERQLLEQPRQTLETALNIQLPDDVVYQVVQDRASLYHLILPYVPAGLDSEQKNGIYRQTADQYDPAWQQTLMALFTQAEDAQFRQRLKDDPKIVLSEFLGLNLPEDMTVKIVENNQNQRYLLLPYNPLANEPGQELDSFNLALLAGGVSSCCPAPTGPGSPPAPPGRHAQFRQRC